MFGKKNRVYLKLEDEDFKKLVAGKEIVVKDARDEHEIHIILADIGWDRMTNHIFDAMKEPE